MPNSGKAILQQYGNAQIWAKLALDTGIAMALLYVFVLERTGSFGMPYQVMALIGVLLMVTIYQWLSIYHHLRTGGLLNEARSLFKAWVTVLFMLAAIAFVTKSTEIYSREVMLKWSVFGYLGQLGIHMLLRFILRLLRSHGYNLRRAILVGGGPQTVEFAQRLARNPWVGIEVAGYANPTPFAAPDDGEAPPGSGLKYLGTMSDVPDAVTAHRADLVFITIPLERSHEIEDVVRELAALHVDIQWVPDMSAFDLINHSVREIEGQPILCLSDSPISGLGRIGKWLEDKVFASAILLISFPVLVAIGVAVKLTSPGPVFFKQKRAGLNGNTIEVYKFRTMYVHDEPDGKLTQASRDDSRITPLGAFLRRTSLDEFPQFVNVLGGSMSIVGPRPHAVEHDGYYETQIDAYMLRHRIKPGITGWAQVNGWRGSTDQLRKMEMRVKYDLHYINNWSLPFDLMIIAMTAWTVLAGKNAY